MITFDIFKSPHPLRTAPKRTTIKLIRARPAGAEHGLFGQVTADPFVRMHLAVKYTSREFPPTMSHME